MAEIRNFKNNNVDDEYIENMRCKEDMDQTARIWSTVKIISHFLNSEEITYDEFLAIFDIIQHYTHHEAEHEEHITRYKNRDDEDFENYYIDIDDEDGEWFVIPVIG